MKMGGSGTQLDDAHKGFPKHCQVNTSHFEQHDVSRVPGTANHFLPIKFKVLMPSPGIF